MTLRIDSSAENLMKSGEEVCGNMIELMRTGHHLTALFADGEGDGTGASVTSSFFLRMAQLLLRNGERPVSIVQSVAEIYAVSMKNRSFPLGLSVIRVDSGGKVAFSSMNMPQPVVLKKSRVMPIEYEEIRRDGLTLVKAGFTAYPDTSLVLFNQGLLLAGQSKGTGWKRQDIEKFLQAAYKPKSFSAAKITKMLTFAAGSLERDRPEHDMSVLSIKLEKEGVDSDDLQNADAENI